MRVIFDNRAISKGTKLKLNTERIAIVTSNPQIFFGKLGQWVNFEDSPEAGTFIYMNDITKLEKLKP